MEALRCKLEAGAAQGDPGSGSLFLIVIEGLLLRITVIDGVTLARGYAEDIAILVDHFSAVAEIFALFDSFGLASGLRLNYSKCALVPLTLSAEPEFDVKVFRTMAKRVLLKEVDAKLKISHSAKYLGFGLGRLPRMPAGTPRRQSTGIVSWK